ncbi:hypothetical protein F4778DRAFT_777378 [Xylariomycetidae sp. FL2044]|nr:hypothetical protein F4778DRAFT_777378 [Xylariomycetidae sp. FL2044]
MDSSNSTSTDVSSQATTSSPPDDTTTAATSETTEATDATTSTAPDTTPTTSDTPTTTLPTETTTSPTPTEETTTTTPSDTPTPTTETPTTTPSTTTTQDTPTTTTPSTTTTTPSPTPTSIITTEFTTGTDGGTSIVTVTRVETPTVATSDSSTATSSGGGIIQSGGSSSSSGGLTQPGKIAVAVVVPIAAVALFVVAGIFFWRKRKQRKDAEEERRKEVEDYNYNPNNDPTLPDVSSVGAGGAYEMKEDASSGYRGWGSTTLAGSTGRKASTTMSGGVAGVAYSDATSPTRGQSDSRSGDGLMGDVTPEGEILGAMGPSTADNRSGNVHRGASNASSSYSAAGRSDGSADNVGVAYGSPEYYDQYGGSNPYNGQQRPGEGGGQPVIRDNPARRNTRIENPAHFPQQSAGISQNF